MHVFSEMMFWEFADRHPGIVLFLAVALPIILFAGVENIVAAWRRK